MPRYRGHGRYDSFGTASTQAYAPRMIVDEIEDLRDARPFQPFEVRMADGASYVIENPNWMLITPNRLTLHFVTRQGRSRFLAMNHITSVAPIETRKGRRRPPTRGPGR